MPEPSSSPPGMEGMSMYASLASSPNASPPRGAQHANVTTRAGPNESLPASVMEVDSKQMVRQATCVILQLPGCCQHALFARVLAANQQPCWCWLADSDDGSIDHAAGPSLATAAA